MSCELCSSISGDVPGNTIKRASGRDRSNMECRLGKRENLREKEGEGWQGQWPGGADVGEDAFK